LAVDFLAANSTAMCCCSNAHSVAVFQRCNFRFYVPS
jgi:hypothetical protein